MTQDHAQNNTTIIFQDLLLIIESVRGSFVFHPRADVTFFINNVVDYHHLCELSLSH